MQSTSAFGMALPEYQHLDWRIDVELGRRSVYQVCAIVSCRRHPHVSQHPLTILSVLTVYRAVLGRQLHLHDAA